MTPAELTRRERIAQGLPAVVEDRAALARLARLFTKKAAPLRTGTALEDRDDTSTPRRPAA